MKRRSPLVWTLGLAAVVGAGVALASGDAGASGAAPEGEPIVFPVFAGTEGAAMVEQLAAAAGLSDTWVRWFVATARGESRFTSNVVLGDPVLYPIGSVPSPMTAELGPNEAAASVTAYERAREQGRFEGCPWPKSAYTFGAGGWFGMMPSNAWAAYHGTKLACRHPWYVLHPVDQLITGIEILRRLSSWSAWKAAPTLLTARVGWSRPEKMGDPTFRSRVASTFADDLELVGLPTDGSTPAPALPPKGDIYARWDALMKDFNFAPGRIG